MASYVLPSLMTFLLYVISDQIYSQDVYPGGVKGVKIWYAAASLPNAQTIWQPKTANPAPDCFLKQETSVQFLNFNPVLHFSPENGSLKIPMGSNDFAQSTFFTVYQPFDSIGEKSIWTFIQEDTPSLALTTRYLADITADTLIDTYVLHKDFPVISTYLQYKLSKTIAPSIQQLQFGGQPGYTKRALRHFSGKIAEIIVFDRVLTGMEKQRVESYLGLKYGIPLAQWPEPVSYLAARGDTIWHAKKFQFFTYNVAGIGRDDASGLYQKQSSCEHTPGLLTIGLGTIQSSNDANTIEIPDNSFLIWSDNGQDLETKSRIVGQPAHLMRLWKISATGQAAGLPTELQFDIRQAETQPSNQEIWWLSIDDSGTGQFPVRQTTYHKMDAVTPDKKASFTNVRWDNDRNGSDLFALSIGPEMMGKMSITPPECATIATGILHIGAEGGRTPYRFILSGPEFQREWISQDNSITDVAGIVPGSYHISIRDADNRAFQDSFFVQSKDAPVAALSNRYELAKGQSLSLDAAAGQPDNVVYRWDGPENFYACSPRIQVVVPGQYILTMERESCISRQEIEIIRLEKNNFKQVSLLPNPVAANTSFSVIIRLHRDGQVKTSLTTLTGAVLKEKTFHGNNFYHWTDRAPFIPGVYLLSLKSEDSVETLKLIVD